MYLSEKYKTSAQLSIQIPILRETDKLLNINRSSLKLIFSNVTFHIHGSLFPKIMNLSEQLTPKVLFSPFQFGLLKYTDQFVSPQTEIGYRTKYSWLFQKYIN